jgi:hypothetical protein
VWVSRGFGAGEAGNARSRACNAPGTKPGRALSARGMGARGGSVDSRTGSLSGSTSVPRALPAVRATRARRRAGGLACVARARREAAESAPRAAAGLGAPRAR